MTGMKRMLGIDFGDRRIGLALSDPTGSIATGLKTILNDDLKFDNINSIIQDKDVECVVVGIPVSLKGGDSKKSADVRNFCSELEKHINVPLFFQDERFSSKGAMATMLAMNTSKKQRQNKARIDEMAAAIILQSYLDRHR